MNATPSKTNPGALNQLAANMLAALESLSRGYEPHPCGGFTTDDMQWRMGTAFIGQAELNEAIDELQAAGLVRYAGFDDKDAIGHCYELK